ncbi:MAG: S41 family peptidase [Sphingomonas sp.]
MAGGSGGSGGSGGTTTAAACSLRDRQNWAFQQLSEWYLFYDTLPASLDPTPYATVGDYVDALTATARAQGHDRYFTYLTSIAEEDAYYASGSSAGFGIRLSYDAAARRVFVAEAFEGTTALAAGIDRGAEILAIGTSSADLRSVSSIIAAQGADGITNALGPNTAGTTRVLRVADAAGTRDLTVAKADYELTPVSSRYGARIIDDGGHKVGYVNLRTFISTADPALRDAFARFRAAGVADVIVDLRYNGGGLVSIAELMANLLGGNRSAADVFTYTSFRPSKSAENSTETFVPQPQSIAPARIAFIGTGGTASASELVINGFIPYLHAGAALIGTNTYGKPVGQIALDRSQCDDRLRVIAFAKQNASHQGAYYSGLAGTIASCRAGDDIAHPMGDPAEASTRAALDFVEGRACAAGAIGAGGQGALSLSPQRELLIPDRPDTAQREVPGLF